LVESSVVSGVVRRSVRTLLLIFGSALLTLPAASRPVALVPVAAGATRGLVGDWSAEAQAASSQPLRARTALRARSRGIDVMGVGEWEVVSRDHAQTL
jgi:hypothetical protein